jgi:hypothetical protein
MMKKILLSKKEIRSRLDSADWEGDGRNLAANFVRCHYNPEENEIYAELVCINEYGSAYGNDERAVLALDKGETVDWFNDWTDIEW